MKEKGRAKTQGRKIKKQAGKTGLLINSSLNFVLI